MHKKTNGKRFYDRIGFLLPALLLFVGGCLSLSLQCKAAVSVSKDVIDVEPTPIRYQNQETGYTAVLEDDAMLLTEEQAAQLALEMRKITTYGNVGFKSLSYNQYSTSYFAEKYYHELFGMNSGTLFLIDMDNREIYIFSDGAVYKTVTNAYANTITDNVYRYASNGDYYTCALTAYQQILSLLSGNRIAQPMKHISNALLALILAALINYFLASSLSRTGKLTSGEILGAASTGFALQNPVKNKTRQTKVYSPSSSGSGGSHSGGGGHHGGGHSGGGGGHRF